MIVALKGLQWPSGEREDLFSDSGYKCARCEMLTIFRPFRTGRGGAGSQG
jgi:hypothetical protein